MQVDKHMQESSGIITVPELMMLASNAVSYTHLDVYKRQDFYNYGDYGVKRMLQEDGVFVDRGYVSYHGTLTLDELMRDDPAERYQQEQDVRMEGMAW